MIAGIWIVTTRRQLIKRRAVEERLRQQCFTLSGIINSSNALVYSVDRQYQYTSFNLGHAAVMKALYGAEIEQGHSLLEYMTVPDDREAARRNLDRALAGEQIVEEAYSGEELRSCKFFQVSHSPIKSEEEIIGVAVLAQDMTERKHSEESVDSLNRELRAISTCNQAMVRAVDEQTLLDDICRIICEEAGYRLAWVGYVEHDEAKTIRPAAWAGLDGEYVANARTSWASDVERGQGPAGESVRSGETRYVQDIAAAAQMAPWRASALQRGYRSAVALPLKDESAEVFGVLLVYSSEPNAMAPDEVRLMEELASDLAYGITVLRAHAEREQAEQALEESEAKTRSILDNVGIGVTLISPQMEILELNHRMREWFPAVDAAQHPLCYRAFNDPPRPVPCDYCPTGKTLQDGLVHEAVTEVPQAGVLRNYRIVSSPVLTASGEVAAAIEMVEDITERLSLESQLRQSQKMEAVGRLAGGVAHDFNNMLGVIIGHAELALEETDPAQPQYASLQEIQKAAGRSADLTRQLLAFARKQTVAPRVLDLNETVEGTLRMLRRLIGEDIDLAWLPGPGVCPVEIDPSQVDQILANLCANARDAIAGVGKITIETRSVHVDEAFCTAHGGDAAGDYTVLAVQDNGRGMPREVLDHLFEPFFTTKGMGQGTGLGLATVYGITRQNGGFVAVASAPGGGTTFEVYLPERRGRPAGAGRGDTAGPIQGGSETVLVVEDEPALLRLGERMLSGVGYTVLCAATPGEALRLARGRAGDIDLVVTDVVMPEMNGQALVERLRAICPRLRWLFMSGYTADVIAHHGVLEEGVAFLQKPYTQEELTDRVREVLDGV
ncbi:MAG: GAF domain-containing protein [Actinobacteria bacterium]|nr:GAF domain-containing protein [Actinomycetota bacterium]